MMVIVVRLSEEEQDAIDILPSAPGCLRGTASSQVRY